MQENTHVGSIEELADITERREKFDRRKPEEKDKVKVRRIAK